MKLPYDDIQAFGKLLNHMQLEATGNLKGLVAFLLDNNQKYHDAYHYIYSLAQVNRNAIIVNTESLLYKSGNLLYNDELISCTFNKFRLFGLEHAWPPGQIDQYTCFLHAVKDNSIFTINNFLSMTVAEDKSFLAFLHSPILNNILFQKEKTMVEQHITKTVTRELSSSDIEQRSFDSSIIDQKNQLICKPSSDYRGNGFYEGALLSETEWGRLTQENNVFQENIKSKLFPAVNINQNNQLTKVMVNLVGGVYMFNGVPVGLMARFSRKPPVNVCNGAYMVPIFIQP